MKENLTNLQGIDGTQEKSSKGVEEEDKGPDTSVEEVDHKMIRTFNKPKEKDELVKSWWETVMSTFQAKEKYAEEPTKEGETGEETKPENEVKVISGITNVKLLLSQEPESILSEDDEEPKEIKLATISAEMRDKQGKVEQNLLSKLDSVKHKWREKLTRIKS